MLGGPIPWNWPIGLLLVGAAGAALAVNRDDWSEVAGQGRYPIRFELPAAPVAQAPVVKAPEAPAALEATLAAEETPLQPPSPKQDFAAAFGGFAARPAASAVNRPAVVRTVDGVIPLRFDLADPYATSDSSNASGSIELKKGVRINGAESGTATIRVTEGATIAIAREELGRMLVRAGQAALVDKLAEAGSFVTFDRIRQSGLNVRYDPIGDRILVSS